MYEITESPYITPTGIELKTQNMTPEKAVFMFDCIALAHQYKDFTIVDKIEAELPWPALAVRKRIEVMKLPISFTSTALFSFAAFTGVVGGYITILIDCLNKFEDKIVTLDDLIDLYPNGWYTEESFGYYVDNHLKKKTFKWAEVY